MMDTRVRIAINSENIVRRTLDAAMSSAVDTKCVAMESVSACMERLGGTVVGGVWRFVVVGKFAAEAEDQENIIVRGKSQQNSNANYSVAMALSVRKYAV